MTGTGSLMTNPQRYCGDNAPNFKIGDQLTSSSFPGFIYTVTQVTPDGTPMAGTWTQPRGGPGTILHARLGWR